MVLKVYLTKKASFIKVDIDQIYADIKLCY